MAGKKQLPPVQLVTSNYQPEEPSNEEPQKPMSLADAVESGSRLDELKAMRRILVGHMESPNTLARDLAALTRQVRELSKEIETLEIQELEQQQLNAEHGGDEDGVNDAAWNPSAI